MSRGNNQKQNLSKALRNERAKAAALQSQLEAAELKLQECKFYEDAVEPLIFCGVPLLEQKLILDKMFAATVENAEENEIDNYTARQASPVFLAMSDLLLRMYKNPDVRFLTES